MRAVLVVIANVVEEKSLQMPFVHSNEMIQQLPPTAFDPALRPSRPGESHPEPLTDPDVNLSIHPARATQ
jgi:hypothetical protein